MEVFLLFYKTNDKLVFHKLIEGIGGNFLNRTIAKYDGDYRSQHFDSKSHLYSMIYMNIRGCKSLRELTTETSSNKKLRRIINVPSNSQFSRKNANRDYRIFEDIFYYLVAKAAKKRGAIKLVKGLPPLKIIDATTIITALKLAPHLKMDDDKSGIKISTMFNGEYPEKINIVEGKVNDRKCIDAMFEDKNSIHVFDRGYYNYRWYDMLTDKGIKFVTRGIKRAIVMEENLISSDLENDIYEAEVTLGSTPGGNLTFNKYREITTYDQDGEPVIFITNIFNLSKEEIIEVYKNRWEIELFFKWIKQNLKIKKFIGYNQNAIKIQIFTALIAYMLIYLNSDLANSKYSILRITRIIRVNLLEAYDDYFADFLRTG